MDGDRAPLADLMEIADRHDGMLVIDEAHATGVFGPEGRGLGADLEGRDNVVSLHTCGKALGVMGALVLGPQVLRDYLVNRCRPFIYATAPSPLVAALVRAALLDLPLRRRTARAAARARRLRRPAARGALRRHAVGLADPAASSSARTSAPCGLPPPCRRAASTCAPCARRRCPEGTARLRLS